MEHSPVYEHNKSPSLFSLTCDSGMFSPHIHPEEAGAVKSECTNNKRRNTIACKDENIEEDISEVDSLDMNTIHLNGIHLASEEKIPVIPRRFFVLPPEIVKQNVVAITLDDVFITKPLWCRDGRYRINRNLEINKHVLTRPVFYGKRVMLLFSGRDVLLEHLWWDREDFGLFDKLAEIGFYAITTPNFSVFAGECPVGHSLNIKKGLLCATELENRGVPTVPHIYAINEHQLSRWVIWLKNNPGVKTVTMNCQLQRRSNVGRDIVIRALQHLLKNTDTNIILHGSDNRILKKLHLYKTRIHTASSGVFKNMEMRKTMHAFPHELWSKATVTS